MAIVELRSECERSGDQSLYLTCTCTAVRRASRAVTRLYDLVLDPAGLKATQFITLSILDTHGKITQSQFAREYAKSPEALSRSLSSLRRKKMIEFHMEQARRERVYSLTPQGKEALEHARLFWNRAEARLAQILPEASLASLLEALDRLAVAAQEAEQLRTSNTAFKTSAAG